MALADTARLVASIELQDKLSPQLANIEKKLSGLEGGLFRIGRGAGQVAGGFDRIATRAGLAAAGGLAAVVTTAVSFEDAFADVRKTVDATEPELDALNEAFREMARTIPISFEELSALGGTAGALGIAVDAIDEFTRTAALLGVTTDLAAQDAATSLGVLSNVLSLTADDFDNFGAALVELGNTGASTESAILAIAEQAGAGAALVGVAADEVLGWSSAIANLGIEAEAGGTSLQKFFVESLRLIQDDDTLEVLAETAGVTGDAFKQAFEEDASEALESFIVGLAKLEDAERLAVLEALGFNDIRITRALLGLAGDTDNLTDSLNTANSAWEENTALNEEAAKRFKTTASQLQIVKNNVRDAANTVGSELLPVIGELTTEFVEFLNKTSTQADIKEFARDLADGIRTLVGELRGTDFSGIIDGIKLAAEVSKAAFDAFRALPQPIQQLAIAALVANKATGGAVGQIAAGLANIAGGFFGLRGASAANPMWVQSVGGIGGGGPGGGGAGAAGANVIRILGTATLFTAIATAIGEVVAQNITRPLNPTQFDFNQIAGASGQFNRPEQAAAFAQALASELDMPLDEVKQGIVDAVNTRGLTFEQAVRSLRSDLNPVFRQLTEAEKENQTALQSLPKLQNITKEEFNRTRREAGAGFTSVTSAAKRDAEQTRQQLENLRGVANRQHQTAMSQLASQGTSNFKLAQLVGYGPPRVGVTVISNVTISEIQRKITSQQIAIGKGPLEF